MTNEEILKAAIEKAEKNGFDIFCFGVPVHSEYNVQNTKNPCMKNCTNSKWSLHEDLLVWFWDGEGHCSYSRDYESIIFSHDFAKAFWGEKLDDSFYNDRYWTDASCCSGAIAIFSGKNWQYHLQQLVLAENKLKYLEQFL